MKDRKKTLHILGKTFEMNAAELKPVKNTKDAQQIVRVGNKSAKDMAKVTNKANMLRKLAKRAEKVHPMGTPVHKIQGPSKRAEIEHIECGCELCVTARRGVPADLSPTDNDGVSCASKINEILAYMRTPQPIRV